MILLIVVVVVEVWRCRWNVLCLWQWASDCLCYFHASQTNALLKATRRTNRIRINTIAKLITTSGRRRRYCHQIVCKLFRGRIASKKYFTRFTWQRIAIIILCIASRANEAFVGVNVKRWGFEYFCIVIMIVVIMMMLLSFNTLTVTSAINVSFMFR